MTTKRVTLDITNTSGEVVSPEILLDVGPYKESLCQYRSATTPPFILDNFIFNLAYNSAGKQILCLSTVDGTATIDGFIWQQWGSYDYSNMLLTDMAISTSPVAITGSISAVPHAEVQGWFWEQGIDNRTLYCVHLFMMRTKLIRQVWKE